MPDLESVAAERVDEVMPRQELLGLPDLPLSNGGVERIARRAGRPPGSRNRRMEDAAATAITHFGDPLLRQVAIATMDTEELALRLGCSALEAVVEQRLAAAAVLPFLHSRKPIAVDLRDHRVVHLRLNLDGQAPAQQAAAATVARVVERLEYQEVNDGAPDAV
jgi:hypothetical protein